MVKLEDLACSPVRLVGRKQVFKSLRAGQRLSVFLAADADPLFSESVHKMCADHGISPDAHYTAYRLGKACGIDVGVAAAAIPLKTDENL